MPFLSGIKLGMLEVWNPNNPLIKYLISRDARPPSSSNTSLIHFLSRSNALSFWNPMGMLEVWNPNNPLIKFWISRDARPPSSSNTSLIHFLSRSNALSFWDPIGYVGSPESQQS
jgi:hypothetical protein